MNETTTTTKSEYNLYIPYTSYVKLFSYVHGVSTEIGGFADITFEPKTKEFTMGDVYILPQKVTGASVDISNDDMSRFLYEQIKGGKAQLPQLSWHSHVNMSVFCSGTDENAYTDELKNGSYFVSIVVNKKEEVLARLNLYTPFECVIPPEVTMDTFPDISEAIQNEIAEKVIVHTPVTKTIYTPNPKPIQHIDDIDRDDMFRDEGMEMGLYNADGTITVHGEVFNTVTELPKKYKSCKYMIDRGIIKKTWHYPSESYVYVHSEKQIVYTDLQKRFFSYWPVYNG